jgi:hypothetical protein
MAMRIGGVLSAAKRMRALYARTPPIATPGAREDEETC